MHANLAEDTCGCKGEELRSQHFDADRVSCGSTSADGVKVIADPVSRQKRPGSKRERDQPEELRLHEADLAGQKHVKARPISLRVSPAFQRRQSSAFCSCDKPGRPVRAIVGPFRTSQTKDVALTG